MWESSLPLMISSGFTMAHQYGKTKQRWQIFLYERQSSKRSCICENLIQKSLKTDIRNSKQIYSIYTNQIEQQGSANHANLFTSDRVQALCSTILFFVVATNIFTNEILAFIQILLRAHSLVEIFPEVTSKQDGGWEWKKCWKSSESED